MIRRSWMLLLFLGLTQSSTGTFYLLRTDMKTVLKKHVLASAAPQLVVLKPTPLTLTLTREADQKGRPSFHATVHCCKTLVRLVVLLLLSTIHETLFLPKHYTNV